jgi:hypothetical protein
LALRSCNRELRKQHAHCPILREQTTANRRMPSES